MGYSLKHKTVLVGDYCVSRVVHPLEADIYTVHSMVTQALAELHRRSEQL